MPPNSAPVPPKKSPRVPFMVVFVALYQLAKAGFLAWVFLQCLQSQGSGAPAFGEVEMHNPVFESPYFLFFAILAVLELLVAVGLLSLARWARAGSTLVLLAGALWWVEEHIMGYNSLHLPVETSTVLAAVALEVIAITILYATPNSRQAFAPAASSR